MTPCYSLIKLGAKSFETLWYQGLLRVFFLPFLLQYWVRLNWIDWLRPLMARANGYGEDMRLLKINLACGIPL